MSYRDTTDSEKLAQAIAAHYRKARREGYEDCQINQPACDSPVYEDRVVLCNSRGYMHTYDLTKRRFSLRDEDRALIEG